MVEFDVLIKNATIIEGTDEKAYKGSIGVKGDKVEALGDIKGDAKKTINAKGLTATPGFIDAHSHADWTLLWFPRAESYVMQGVTTFVGGQCGGSPAPLGEHIRVPRLLSDHLPELDPYKFYPKQPYYPLEQVNEWMKEIFGWTLTWEDMEGYFKKVDEVGISMNYAPLVGHGSVRTKVMGLDYKRHSTEEEQAEMREHIHEAMKQGCIGMSAGLDYDPDVFAAHEEIIDGVSVLKEYNGVYCPHWRRTGRRRGIAAGHVPNEKITALMECVDVHNKTGVRLHYAHMSTGWQIYPTPPDELEAANVKATLDMITKDSNEELDITWDAIPRMTRSGFAVMPYLASLYSPWLRELGGLEEFAKWLKVKDFREEVKDAIQRGKWFIRVAYNPNTNPRWAENIHVLKSKVPGVDGKSIAQIAKERGADEWDTWLDIIAEDPHARGATGQLVPGACYLQYYTNPKGMVGLDTSVYDDKYQAKSPPYSFPGINTFSAYPLFFIKYVRDGSLFTVEEAVQKTATLPARVHNLEGRGVLKEGGYADIVLMNLPKLKVLSDEIETRRHPKGIEYVFVNGKVVVEKGTHTDARAGRVLKWA
ncbi:MAG: amidohydrolase family protein [Candidatus Bathyarchaeota archaeon]|nr:MAG: amidohydrolase family protein [Candidatus Bathyarchaeota archaeon]